ncbi:hypothetical protein D9M71_473050 [compost metagenome]
MQRRAAVRVEGVRVALAVALAPVAVVAGGGDGGVGQLQAGEHLAPAVGRRLQGDAPGAVGLLATGAQLAVDAHQIALDAVALQAAGQLVDAEALGDAVEVEADLGLLAHGTPFAVEGQCRGGRATGRLDRARRRRAETPGADLGAEGDVEGAVRQAADMQPGEQYLVQLVRQVEPLPDRRAVQAHQGGVRLPGRHLRIDPVHRRLQLGLDGLGVEPGGGVEHRAEAAAHGLPAQAVAHQRVGFSKRLHGSAPVP